MFRRGKARGRLSILLTFVLILKAAAIAAALAAPARAATPGAGQNLQAALSYICTATGAKVLPADGDGKARHGATFECPLCAAAGHQALPCLAILLPPPPATASPHAAAVAITWRETLTPHVRPRAPPLPILA